MAVTMEETATQVVGVVEQRRAYVADEGGSARGIVNRHTAGQRNCDERNKAQ